jgi:hypothetical protein
MLAMSLGFAIMLVGSFVEEFSIEALGIYLMEVHVLENAMVAVRLLLLVYSTYDVLGQGNHAAGSKGCFDGIPASCMARFITASYSA